MATVSKIIEKAKSFVGTKEKGNNNVIFNTDYYGKPVNGNAYPWCAVFIWDIFRMCGASRLYYGGDKCAYTPTLAQFYKSKGQWYATPKVGDLVFFKWTSSKRICHVGIVIEIVSKTEIKTIEGNTSIGNDSNGGEVMIRTRNFNCIEGFARPEYLPEDSTPSKSISYYKKYTGASFMVDEVFKVIGVPEKYRGNAKNRNTVATANNIKNYKGTSEQNMKLIQLAKNGKLIKP